MSDALQAVKLATPNQTTMLYTPEPPKPQRARRFTKSTNIVNLSTYKLTPAEENLLNKGLNFIPTPSREHPLHILQDFLLFDRKLRLKYFFMDKEIENNTSPEDRPFKLTTGWTPPPPSNPRHKL